MQLRGAHVLVTGASRGIGREIALEAARRGAVVTGLARTGPRLEELAGLTGGHALPVDLGIPAARVGVVDRAAALGGPVDAVVNTAGLDVVGSFLELSAESLESAVQVNLVAAAELCRQVLPGMLQRGRGHLVNVSSGFSTVLGPGMATYCATKAGLSHLTGGLRLELQGTPVDVTLVELGPVDTDMWSDLQDHPVAGPSLTRALRLRAVRRLDPAVVARSVLDGVEAGDAHVVLPRRMRTALALTWLPRRARRRCCAGYRAAELTRRRPRAGCAPRAR